MYLKIQRGKKVLDSGCEAMNGYQGEEEETEDRNGKELGDLENIVVGEPSLGVQREISDERGKKIRCVRCGRCGRRKENIILNPLADDFEEEEASCAQGQMETEIGMMLHTDKEKGEVGKSGRKSSHGSETEKRRVGIFDSWKHSLGPWMAPLATWRNPVRLDHN